MDEKCAAIGHVRYGYDQESLDYILGFYFMF
jgi:hypothetical protein